MMCPSNKGSCRKGKKERLELDARDRITEGIETRRAKTPKVAWSRGHLGRVIEPDPTEGRGTPIFFVVESGRQMQQSGYGIRRGGFILPIKPPIKPFH